MRGVLGAEERGNRIRAEGAGRLAGVLGQCSSLAVLNLKYNGIGADGITMLQSKIQGSTRLLV